MSGSSAASAGEVRETLAIQPGEKLEVFHHENRIELIPIREMRGFLRGIDTTHPGL